MRHSDNTPHLLILGKGEIARQLAALAVIPGYPVEAVERGAPAMVWPQGVRTCDQVYTDAPWKLPPHTHAVIARGHDGDAESVASLLNHDAEHVYLIASARRAQSVIEAAMPHLQDPGHLSRLSAPAGLDLGGNSSAEIALSLLAEIQASHYGATMYRLNDLRTQRLSEQGHRADEQACPGKRP